MCPKHSVEMVRKTEIYVVIVARWEMMLFPCYLPGPLPLVKTDIFIIFVIGQPAPNLASHIKETPERVKFGLLPPFLIPNAIGA